MINQQQLSTKLKSTSKMSLGTRKTSVQEYVNTPTTSVVMDKQDGFTETIRKIEKEEFKARVKIVSKIIKSNYKTTNERLDEISTEALELKLES